MNYFNYKSKVYLPIVSFSLLTRQYCGFLAVRQSPLYVVQLTVQGLYVSQFPFQHESKTNLSTIIDLSRK